MFGGSYIDLPADESAGQWETGLDTSGYAMASGDGQAHLGVAGLLFLAIGLKAFTESNLISTDLAEIKLSLLNIFAIVVLYKAGNAMFRALTVWMASRGLALPGQEAVAAL